MEGFVFQVGRERLTDFIDPHSFKKVQRSVGSRHRDIGFYRNGLNGGLEQLVWNSIPAGYFCIGKIASAVRIQERFDRIRVRGVKVIDATPVARVGIDGLNEPCLQGPGDSREIDTDQTRELPSGDQIV